MAQLPHLVISPEDREKMASRLTELAEILLTDPDRIIEASFSWVRNIAQIYPLDPHYEERIKAAPHVYTCTIKLYPGVLK